MTDQNTNRTPEDIRDEIDRTRASLGSDVDALADKVNPSSIAHRQTAKVKGKLASIKESVMGTVEDVQSAGSEVTGRVSDLPGKATASAKGNPLAVGLVAFGVGLLVASLIPASEKEKDVAAAVKDTAGPMIDSAKEAVQDAVGNLKEPAKDAVSAVRDSARDAADVVKDEASTAAAEVRDTTQDSTDALQKP